MAQRVRDLAQQSNVSEETFLEHYSALSASKQAIDDANSEHRNRVKAAKSVGLDTKALLQVLAESRMDPDKRRSRFKSVETYRRWIASAPGTQWELTGELANAAA